MSITFRDVIFLLIGLLMTLTFLNRPEISSVVSLTLDLPTSGIVSETLFESVRVYCFIISTKDKTEDKAIHVQETWAKRCNKHVFVTANEESGLPSLDFDINESRANLFAKIEYSLRHIYENELNNYDFFLKADYDTYVVMENLRFMLLPHSPNDSLHFGCRLHLNKQYYMSGGAGYVFSREAVRQAVENGFGKLPQCSPSPRPGEDIEIGACMNALNVKAVDTRDAQGRHRMLLLSPSQHLVPQLVDPGLQQYMVYDYNHGEDCCGEYMVSFHYVPTDMMYILDALFYRLHKASVIAIMFSVTFHRQVIAVFIFTIVLATAINDFDFDLPDITSNHTDFDNSTFEDGLSLVADKLVPKTRRLLRNETFTIVKELNSDYRLRLHCPNNAFRFDVWGQGEYAGYIMKSVNESGSMTVDLTFEDAQTLTLKFMHYDTGIYKVKLFEGLATQEYEKEILDFGTFHYWPKCISVLECSHCIYSWVMQKPGKSDIHKS